MLSLDNFIFDARVTLFKLADRGGLAVPSDYCFAVYALAVQAYEAITSEVSRQLTVNKLTGDNWF